MKIKTRAITEIAIIGALYAGLTVALAPISYGPLQVRVAEALTVLPYLTVTAVPGLWIGCLVANIFGGFGLIDILGGSFITLLAALATYGLRKFNKPILAPLPPVIFNAFGVSAYLHLMTAPPEVAILGLKNLPPYFFVLITIGIGEFIACYVLGYPLLLILKTKLKM